MKKTIQILLMAACCVAGGRVLAADMFWYGTAGDGLWNNPANWSTTEGNYTAATVYPNNDSLYIVHLYTHLVVGHAIDITIPADCTDAACRRIRVKDDSAPGSVTITGEGDARVPLFFTVYPNDNYNGGFVRTGTAYPMSIVCRNIDFSGWLYFNWNGTDGASYTTDTVATGESVLIDNCCYTNYSGTSTGQLNPPGNDGAKFTIVDSDMGFSAFARANASGALTLAVTNSTITLGERMRIDGPGTTFDFVGSTLKFTGALNSTDPRILFGSKTDTPEECDANAGMSIRFKDSTIDYSGVATSGRLINTRATARELSFDNVTFTVPIYAIQSPDTNSVTRVKDTSIHFDRGSGQANGTRGVFYLDNGEWVMDTGRIRYANGRAHFIFSGASPCLDPGWMDYDNNTAQPPIFDFIVPAGGYKQAPISLRYSTDGQDKGVFGTIPNTAPNQGTINVLPASKAAKTAGTTICPLVYAKDTQARVNLARGVPTTLPNEKSSFLYTTDGTWDYDAVASKTESDWTSWDGTAGVMGLAVKIVGSGAGLSIFVR